MDRSEAVARVRGSHTGVSLDSVAHLLRLYIEALTGREMVIAPLGSIPEESRINEGSQDSQ